MTVKKYNGDLKQYCERLKAIDPTKTTGLECNWIESYNGTLEKLVANTITTDIPFVSNFVGKVAGSVVENPNIAKHGGVNYLSPPSEFSTENVIYGKINTLNGDLFTTSNNTNGHIKQQLFSFNVIEILERRLEKSIWGTASMLSEKIVIAKNIIKKMTFNWYGYGSSPTGNKSSIAYYTDSWWGTQFHANSTVAKLTITNTTINVPNSPILSNGFVNYIAYAEPSNGTVASVINTDYVELALTLDLTKL